MLRPLATGFFLLLWGLLALEPHPVCAQNDQQIILQSNDARHPQKPQQQPSTAKLALQYYNNKQYEEAAELYGQIYFQNPRRYFSYYFNSLLAIRDYKQAEKVVKKQIKVMPGFPSFKVDHAYVLKLMGNSRKSEKLLQQLINNPNNSRAQTIQLVRALQSRGFLNEALIALENAKKNANNKSDYDLEMATIYQYSGDYDKMFDAYLDFLEKNPRQMQTIRNRMQNLLRFDVENSLQEMLINKLLERSEKNPKNRVYAEMMYWYALQSKDFEMAYRQARAIDKRFGNSEENLLEVAEIALSNREYALAAKAYRYVMEKKDKSPFYLESYAGYFNARVKEAEADLETDESTYRELARMGREALQEIGLNKETVEIALNTAHIEAIRLGENEKAVSLLEDALKINRLNDKEKALLKLELADILLFEGQSWDASLYYSQVENDLKNDALGHEAKFRNARLFYYMGEYRWAQTKLDVLRSATSKLIANDAMELSVFIKDVLDEDTLGLTLRSFGKADLLVYQSQFDEALEQLDKIGSFQPGPVAYQYLLYKKAGLLERVHRYRQADSLYEALISGFPESIKADNALFRRAEIHRRYLDDALGSMDFYMRLMRDYPESIYAGQARIIYRKLQEQDEN